MLDESVQLILVLNEKGLLKNIYSTLKHLINRIYPVNTKEYLEYDEYGYKRK